MSESAPVRLGSANKKLPGSSMKPPVNLAWTKGC
jgi:hypothetical protein